MNQCIRITIVQGEQGNGAWYAFRSIVYHTEEIECQSVEKILQSPYPMMIMSEYAGFQAMAVTDRSGTDGGNFHRGNSVPIGSRTSSVLSSKYLKSVSFEERIFVLRGCIFTVDQVLVAILIEHAFHCFQYLYVTTLEHDLPNEFNVSRRKLVGRNLTSGFERSVFMVLFSGVPLVAPKKLFCFRESFSFC